MKINHLNLVVSNVAEASSFFEAHFNFKCTEIKGDHLVAILKGSDGFTLVIMKSKDGDPVYPEAFHIGFMLDSTEDVTDSYLKLKTSGIIVGREPQKIRDGFGFYFTFENLMIEVGHYY